MFAVGGHWLDTDPSRGVDVSIWDEHISQEKQSKCENYDGKWKNGNCYRYDVI